MLIMTYQKVSETIVIMISRHEDKKRDKSAIISVSELTNQKYVVAYMLEKLTEKKV